MAESDPTGIGRMMKDRKARSNLIGDVYTPKPEPPEKKKKKSSLMRLAKMAIMGGSYRSPQEDLPPAARDGYKR